MASSWGLSWGSSWAGAWGFRAIVVTADGGTYTISGTDATLSVSANKLLSAGSGTYAVSGTAATFPRTYILPASAGSYAVSGTAASLEYGYKVAATAGSYAVSGTAASVRHNYVLVASGGSYTVSGSDVTLAFAGNVTLLVDAGSYTVNGSDVSLRVQAQESASPGGIAFPFNQPAAVDGVGHAILPLLVGHAVGEVGGRVKIVLPAFGCSGAGSAFTSWTTKSDVELRVFDGLGSGVIGVRGAAVSTAQISIVPSAFVLAGPSGKASAVISAFKGAAMGDHEPDEAIIMAWLMAS